MIVCSVFFNKTNSCTELTPTSSSVVSAVTRTTATTAKADGYSSVWWLFGDIEHIDTFLVTKTT